MESKCFRLWKCYQPWKVLHYHVWKVAAKHGTGHLRSGRGADTPSTVLLITAMESKTAAGLESRDRPKAPAENQRVTARIVRESGGTTHREYCAGGRSYGSLEALQAALSPESTHAQPRTGETHVINGSENNA